MTGPASCVHGNVPIGRPYPGLHPLVVGEDGAPVADGESGELCMAGPQTTPGYWRAPDLTAERYFPYEGRTYYRTGDLVRLEGDAYVHLGRNDQQVKIGGYRVELGEIEAVLRRAGAVEAVALRWPDDHTVTAVVCGDADPAALTAACEAALPPYMTPARIHVLAEMPLNGNGKTDRGALRDLLRAGL